MCVLVDWQHVPRVHAFCFSVRLGNQRVSATHDSVCHFRSSPWFTALGSSPQLSVLFHDCGCNLCVPLGFSPFHLSFSFMSIPLHGSELAVPLFLSITVVVIFVFLSITKVVTFVFSFVSFVFLTILLLPRKKVQTLCDLDLHGWLLLFPEPHITELLIVYAFVKKRPNLSASSSSHVCFFKVAAISWRQKATNGGNFVMHNSNLIDGISDHNNGDMDGAETAMDIDKNGSPSQPTNEGNFLIHNSNLIYGISHHNNGDMDGAQTATDIGFLGLFFTSTNLCGYAFHCLCDFSSKMVLIMMNKVTTEHLMAKPGNVATCAKCPKEVREELWGYLKDKKKQESETFQGMS
ncbi:hypothetical protein JHK87_033815 [Glycine soja]|nr:hypothetical protein JHK87_033815 [Glycine soja]